METDQLKAIDHEVRFLGAFLNYMKQQCSEEAAMKISELIHLLEKMESKGNESQCSSDAMMGIDQIKQELRAVCIRAWEPVPCNKRRLSFKADEVIGFLDSLLVYLTGHLMKVRGELKVAVSEQVKALKEKLRCLRILHKYVTKKYTQTQKSKDLLVDIGVVVNGAGYISLMFLVNGMEAEMNLALCDLQEKIDSIYLQVLCVSSKSSELDTPTFLEHIVSFLDFLLNILSVLRIPRTGTPIAPVIDEIRMVLKQLRILVAFQMDEAKQQYSRHEKLNDFSMHIEVIANQAGHAIFLSSLNQRDEGTVEDLSRELELINTSIRDTLYKFENSLYKFEKSSAGMQLMLRLLDHLSLQLKSLPNVYDMKDKIKTVVEELIILIIFTKDTAEQHREHEALNDLLADIEAMINEVHFLISSIRFVQTDQSMGGKVNLLSSDLREKINDAKAKFSNIKFIKLSKSSWSDICRIQGVELYVIDPLLQNLEELLKHKPYLVSHVKEEVEVVQQELMYLNNFLKDTAGQHIDNQELKYLAASIKGLACKAEYIIDSIVVGDEQVWCFNLWLSHLVEEIKVVETKVFEICKKNSDFGASSPSTICTGELSQSNSLMSDEFFGFEDEVATLRGYLTGRQTQLQVISIVGLAGLGKTTLANKLYNDSYIANHFNVRAWCTVSQIYQKRKLLLDLLSSANITLSKPIDDVNDQQLAEEFRKYLLNKRYLIVIDDVWNIGAWNDLRKCFASNQQMGSRIVFTSRLKEVVLEANSKSILVEPQFLSDINSWNLLEKEVFKGKPCPKYLIDVGKKIAKNCKGLPHSIVVVAGLLAKTEKRRDWWEKVAQSTGAHILGEEGSMKILELSYNNLPDHLRACFLYLGIFPEDHEIPVRKLLLLWIGEGFISETEDKSLEHVAEDYLMDLITRSLVISSKRRSKGGVKACRLHDLQHEFCVRKAKEVRFISHLPNDGENNIYCHALLPPTSYTPYLLQLDPEMVYQLSPDPRIRSLKITPHPRSLRMAPYLQLYDRAFSFKYGNFKLVKVMEVQVASNLRYIDMRGIEQLVHLKYLRLQCRCKSIPASISNLWNLKTLILHGSSPVVQVPYEVFSMVKLRHLIVRSSARLLGPKEANLQDSLPLEQRQTLSKAIVPLSTGSWENALKRFPNLRKLRCIIHNRIPNLAFLIRLESLNLDYFHMSGPYTGILRFPSGLKKLTLSKFYLSWSEMSTIANLLPNLEVLKLLDNSFVGKCWDVNKEVFPELKFLKLQRVDLEQWAASPEHFAKLERLVLENCKRLEEIPFGLGDIPPTLGMIEVIRCRAGVADSATKIQEYQREEMGNEHLKVIIRGPLFQY